jgi:hypothetical protein
MMVGQTNGERKMTMKLASLTIAAALLAGTVHAQSFEHPVQAAMRDCAAGTAPTHVCETLRLAEAACDGTVSVATFLCISDQIARRKVEVTPRGVTILRGGN